MSVYLAWYGFTAVLLKGAHYLSPALSGCDLTSNIAILIFIAAAFSVTSFFFAWFNIGGTSFRSAFRGVFLFTIALQLLIYLAVARGFKASFLYSLATINLIAFSWVVGSYLADVLKKPSELVPLCVVMSLADMFSVAAGPTSHMAQSLGNYYRGGATGMPPLVDFIILKAAVPGYENLVPLFGVSDWVMVVFFYGAVLKFKLNDNVMGKGGSHGSCSGKRALYFPAAVVGLAVAVLSARTLGIFIPALPVMAFCFLAVSLFKNPEVRKLEKREWQLVFAASLIMGALIIVFHMS